MKSPIPVSPFTLARHFLGVGETAGAIHNPQVLAMLQSVDSGVMDDETPWCSAFVNYVAWLLDCPRSRSLSARSWLKVGDDIPIAHAQCGFHVVVLKRGGALQPGPGVLKAPGHVGFFVRYDGDEVFILGGNQGNRVTIAPFPRSRVLGVREI